MKYKINEIFYTIQGEGHYTGRPAVFIRFSGCNLKCPFCDTKFDTYNLMTTEEIIREINCLTSGNNSGLLVVLTGGEPTLQVSSELIDALHKEKLYIAIETNGTHKIPEKIDWITYSPKEQTTNSNSQERLSFVNELKIVYIGQDVEKYYNNIKALHYYLQPCSGKNIKETVEYILKHPHWQLSLQTQKIIGIK